MPTDAPTLFRINGIGTSVYGKRDLDVRSGTYVKTLVFTAIFIPLFCLAAYRVADAPGSAGWFSFRDGWYFLERVPLSLAACAYNWVIGCGIVGVVILTQAGLL